MLKLARVVNVHPESHSVDLVVMDDNRRFSGVKVLAGSAGGDFGISGLAVPTNTGYDARNSGKRDIYAVIDWMGFTPVVLGFLHPEVSQVLFRDKERMVYRHPSDVYLTVDGEGNTELHHPSGAFVRLGTSPAHEDLSGKDVDGVWAISRNTDKAVHIRIEQAGGGAYVDIDPAGNVVVKAAKVTLNTPLTVCTGDLGVKGNIGALGDITAGGGSVSLKNHIHPGVHGPTGAGGGGGPMPPTD